MRYWFLQSFDSGAPNDTLRTNVSEASKRGMNGKDTHSYVGFANFPNQVFRRAIKNGFEFTLMVVGRVL